MIRKVSYLILLAICSNTWSSTETEEENPLVVLQQIMADRVLALYWRIEDPLYLLAAQKHVPLPPEPDFEQPLGSKPVRVVRPYNEDETLGAESAKQLM